MGTVNCKVTGGQVVVILLDNEPDFPARNIGK